MFLFFWSERLATSSYWKGPLFVLIPLLEQIHEFALRGGYHYYRGYLVMVGTPTILNDRKLLKFDFRGCVQTQLDPIVVL